MVIRWKLKRFNQTLEQQIPVSSSKYQRYNLHLTISEQQLQTVCPTWAHFVCQHPTSQWTPWMMGIRTSGGWCQPNDRLRYLFFSPKTFAPLNNKICLGWLFSDPNLLLYFFLLMKTYSKNNEFWDEINLSPAHLFSGTLSISWYLSLNEELLFRTLQNHNFLQEL